jgi:hypothetical protein
VEIQLTKLLISDLDFPQGALTREIIGSDRDRDLFGNPAPFNGGKARQLGLELCPAAIGPELRLQYPDQPSGERVHIAMVPIKSEDGEPRIFVVAHGADGLSLDAARARPDDYWAPDTIFVFSLGTRSPGGERT